MDNIRMCDLYYSEEREKSNKNDGEDPNNVFINGRWYVYTECTTSGKEPLCLSRDLVFVGTVMDVPANFKYRQKVEGVWRKKKIYEENKCDGYCQLCISSSCHTKRIIDV